MTTPPEVMPTGRYSIAETARHIGKSVRTVQRYVEAGTIKVNIWKPNKKTFVTGLEILRIWNQII